MRNFLAPPPHKELLPEHKIDSHYKFMRWQVFMGIFIGYAGYYLVRKNFSLVMPDLIEQGYTKGQLGIVVAAVSISYGLSKFIMAGISDRSNARVFLSLGLLLSGLVMFGFGTIPLLTSSVAVMFAVMFINGWFQGMGWPPCGRVMVHWFSTRERGTKMSIWNVAHNIGGGLIGPLAIAGVAIFGDWQSKLYFPALLAIGVSMITYLLVRDTPQSCGLPNIEAYKNDYPRDYDESHEQELSTKEIFFTYVFKNKLLWLIAIANAMIYLVRYGVLDWAPTYLHEVKHFDLDETGWAYFLYEWAGIPGTLLCGVISDKIFKGRRAPTIIIYMLLVMVAVFVYWKNPPGHVMIDNFALIAIGFLIYGPVMLIGVQALDLVPKKAAGTAAGLTGLFGYLGGALFANIVIGFIAEHMGWDATFILLLVASAISILFIAFTWNTEKRRLSIET